MASRSPEVRHLRALSIVALELHFGRAAQRLNMTQPALSQLIRDLESRLGFRVLERTTRKVRLTGPGRSFLADAEEILRRLDSAVESARAEAGQAANSIRVGVIMPTTFAFLPAVLTAFRRRYPDAEVYIEIGESRQLLRSVETGHLQLAILRPPGKSGTLRAETIRREPFLAAMRNDHPLAKVATLRLRDLKGEKFVRILRADPDDPFSQINQQLESAGVDLAGSKGADVTLTALALVCAGDGIALVPSWAAGLPWHDVCFKELEDLDTRIDLTVIWENAGLSPIAQHFIDVARRIAT